MPKVIIPFFALLHRQGNVLDMHHRPGNVHDSNGAVDFMLRCFQNTKSQLPGTLLESSMDAAFFNQEIISLMAANQVFTLASMMARNFSKEMQMLAHQAATRPKSKRPTAWKFHRLDTIRHQIIQRAGRFN